MILGRCDDRSFITVRLEVSGPRTSMEVWARIDTGFNGDLVLSPRVIRALGLPAAPARIITLADGTRRITPSYVATLLWNGAPRRARALEVDSPALLGVGLLAGCQLVAEFTGGGSVLIEKLGSP